MRKKVLVLAGGFPQIALINKLKKRGYYVLLADYYENPVAKENADEFFRISTLDVPAIKKLARDNRVDFLITVCTDQSLLTVAQVSDELKLPCYIDYQIALNVTNKQFMKKVFVENDIPTARYKIFDSLNVALKEQWNYPVIVKPVDCNSSKGVKKALNPNELKKNFKEAFRYSRSNTVLVEDFIDGEEYSVDVYVDNGKAHVLDITKSEKINFLDRFVIFRTWHQSSKMTLIEGIVAEIAQKIADAFNIVNAPMLIQVLEKNGEIIVIEFSARTGGGVKHLSIERQTGLDMISAVIDLTEGKNYHIKKKQPIYNYMIDEYIYCYPGIFDHIEGFEELVKSGYILDYYLFRSSKSIYEKVENSGDRLAGFTIVGDDLETLNAKHNYINSRIRAIDRLGNDIIRHDLLPQLIH